MNAADKWLHTDPAYVTKKHQDDKVIAHERGGFILVILFLKNHKKIFKKPKTFSKTKKKFEKQKKTFFLVKNKKNL